MKRDVFGMIAHAHNFRLVLFSEIWGRNTVKPQVCPCVCVLAHPFNKHA